MATENNQKIKMLKLVELLRRETDEDHPMRTTDICNRLIAMNITCDRRTLHKDMRMLNEQGYEVMCQRIGHENYYYVADQKFSLPELKILMDAVQAASFITEKKSAELIEKLAALAGGNRSEVLKSNLVCFNTRKHTNEKIYYIVDSLEDAIRQDKKVIFRYYDLNENGERVFRRSGHHYVVEPVALVFNEDNYYLLVYSARHKGTASYRVDRMDAVEIINEGITESAMALRETVSAVTDSAFKMFGGEPTRVTLEFSDTIMGAVYDRFGENITMRRTDEHTIQTTVNVQVSPTFRGWVYQFGELMRVVEPKSVAKQFK